MSINTIRAADGTLCIDVDPESIENFKQILARACNVWPDAPVEVKEFHDMILHGHLLQDYRNQPVYRGREELAASENEKLDSWSSENKEPGN